MSGLQLGLVGAWQRQAWWLWLLRPLELVFRSVAAIRRTLYRRGILTSYRSHKPLVVVGNITVGGTGKTPVVIALVEALQAAGIRAGVVSRGYGATAGNFPHVVGARSSAADCGDEPLLIFRRTGGPCVVSPSRGEALRTMLLEFEVDVVLSDDGLQHYAMERDFEIAVLDSREGTGNGFCLPAGPLREPVSRLEAVDYVLYRGSNDPDHGVSYAQDCLVNLASGEQRPVAPQSIGTAVYGVAGIGQPAQFFDTLRRAGFEVDERVFADHHPYVAADFTGLADRPVIMTEKDAVKCIPIAGNNAWYLRINARLPDPLVQAVTALVRP